MRKTAAQHLRLTGLVILSASICLALLLPAFGVGNIRLTHTFLRDAATTHSVSESSLEPDSRSVGRVMDETSRGYLGGLEERMPPAEEFSPPAGLSESSDNVVWPTYTVLAISAILGLILWFSGGSAAERTEKNWPRSR